MNVYQAAMKLRNDYAHTGIDLDATECAYTNLYFVFHDALHTYLGCAPTFEEEDQVLATEKILGGMDASAHDIPPDVLSAGMLSIPTDQLEIMIDFYTNWFNR